MNHTFLSFMMKEKKQKGPPREAVTLLNTTLKHGAKREDKRDTEERKCLLRNLDNFGGLLVLEVVDPLDLAYEGNILYKNRREMSGERN